MGNEVNGTLEFTKETHEISGARKLYRYTFTLNGEELAPPPVAVIDPEPSVVEPGNGRS